MRLLSFLVLGLAVLVTTFLFWVLLQLGEMSMAVVEGVSGSGWLYGPGVGWLYFLAPYADFSVRLYRAPKGTFTARCAMRAIWYSLLIPLVAIGGSIGLGPLVDVDVFLLLIPCRQFLLAYVLRRLERSN